MDGPELKQKMSPPIEALQPARHLNFLPVFLWNAIAAPSESQLESASHPGAKSITREGGKGGRESRYYLLCDGQGIPAAAAADDDDCDD